MPVPQTSIAQVTSEATRELGKPLDAEMGLDIASILSKHKNKNFVQRILNPSRFPTLDFGGGRAATHLMATSEVDGKHIVYPTVIFDEKLGQLKQLDDKAAIDHAMKTGEFIEFDNPVDALTFSTDYKKFFGK